MSDSFSMNVFKDSFRKIFEADSTGYLQHAYNAKLEVLCSKEFKVCSYSSISYYDITIIVLIAIALGLWRHRWLYFHWKERASSW